MLNKVKITLLPVCTDYTSEPNGYPCIFFLLWKFYFSLVIRVLSSAQSPAPTSDTSATDKALQERSFGTSFGCPGLSASRAP